MAPKSTPQDPAAETSTPPAAGSRPRRKKAAAAPTAAPEARPATPAAVKRIPLRITDTTLRDAHQSLWATRMRTRDIIEIIDVVDRVGYYSLEVWGGATFDVCLRFLRENPWERLRQIKQRCKKTPLQMLLRGQNILGYKNYPDDLLNRFVELAVANGVDIFRIFDALNDNRNIEQAVRSVKKAGGHAQGTLCYTISPVHTVEEYVRVAKEQVQMGVDSIAIKDMAGILSPISAERLISALAANVSVPIQLHSHCTSGMATATYVEGVRAGAGAIDCAISVMSSFSSQPPVETMLAVFDETPYHANLDVDALRKICQFFEQLAPKRQLSHHPLNPIDPDILIHHIPGGMISNLRQQLEQQQALDRLGEVLEELPRVRKDMGYPPLVTPTSQIIGVQAVMNVLSGERYSLVPQETREYVRGYYGRSPAPIDPEVRRKILGKEKPITTRPADMLEPVLPNATKDVDPKLIQAEEDIISYCLFPEVALGFFKWRALPFEERPSPPVDLERRKEDVADKPKAEPPPAPPQPFLASQDYRGIHDLLTQVNQLGFSELVIRRNDLNLSLKASGVTASQTEAPAAAAAAKPEPAKQGSADAGKAGPTAVAPAPAPAPEGKAAEAAKPAEAQAAPQGPAITAPLNGTFYRSGGPGKPRFVEEGGTVKAGEPVCIVEAMKLFNQIKAPVNCKVVKFLVEHGAAVTKGQALATYEEVK